ncbi:MAG: M55 family metallopeptidase [Armatimonadetes bacterium]|nr:M55 family metallopeptidase [Armatimonadota bacterium]MDE2207100.1 M55 family metallopeptidase [Armatimonadota bacterium]
MNLFISVDIEGISGIASFSQCMGPDAGQADWAYARRMLTGDVNAAIRGARRGGADRVVVKDSHAGCRNLLIGDLEPGTELISGWKGPVDLYMMEGLDQESFDGVFLVGYHAMAGTLEGAMEHALSGSIHSFTVNDVPAGEIYASAAMAGDLRIPTLLVTSDQAGCDEAAGLLRRVQTVATKRAMARSMSWLRHPHDTVAEIEEKAEAAVRGRTAVEPFSVVGEVKLAARFRGVQMADTAAALEGSVRRDAYTIEVFGSTFTEAYRRFGAVLALASVGAKVGD